MRRGGIRRREYEKERDGLIEKRRVGGTTFDVRFGKIGREFTTLCTENGGGIFDYSSCKNRQDDNSLAFCLSLVQI